jgi:hypothetical protein
LCFIAAQGSNGIELLPSLNPLRSRRHTEAESEHNDRLYDGHRATQDSDILDEGLVDFDLVKRKALKIAQRRIAGTESNLLVVGDLEELRTKE